MIQRIQSVWLFVGAMLHICLFFLPYYVLTVASSVPVSYLAQGNYVCLLLTVTLLILPVVTIFLFKNRKKQIQLSLVSIFCDMVLVFLFLWNVYQNKNGHPGLLSGNFSFGAVVPALCIVFFMLAISGIRKDDKLVKSVDRLR